MQSLAKTAEQYLDQTIQLAPKLIFLIIIYIIVLKILRSISKNLIRYLIEKQQKNEKISREQEKRFETIIKIIDKIIFIFVSAVGFIILLNALGINTAPIVTAAGIFGLAISFGAQNLVRDFISGFFMLIENQVRVGDVAVINGTGGLVEQINLRTIVLRDAESKVHIFANGSINSITNLTKSFSAHVFEIGVAYKEDVDRVMSIMRDVGDEMMSDDELKDKIEKFEVLGVERFDDSAVVIKGKITTKPIEQWTIGREFKRRIKIAFDKNEVEIPFPHRTLYFGEVSKPFEIKMTGKEGK